MNEGFLNFRRRIMNPINFRLFLLTKLPLVYFTGIRISQLSESSCTTSAKYGWLNQNPFKSMYFAVMQMAAELSTGVLCMGNTYQQHPGVSMLVIKTEGQYYKKATGIIKFTCKDGLLISEVVQKTRTSGEGYPVRCYSYAENDSGEVIAEFWITWSLKAKMVK